MNATLESFAQRLLDLGMQKAETMSPDQVKMKDVIAGQKLLIEKQKVKLTEDSMILKMAELFGPGVTGLIEDELPTPDYDFAKEAEIVDEQLDKEINPKLN